MEDIDAAVDIVFFPFVGGGHQIPMIDIARLLASHGAKSTVVATPTNALQFQNSINRDQRAGCSIFIHALNLPENSEIPDSDMSAGPFTDTSILRDPFRVFLLEKRPDCVVVDGFHRWAADTIDELQIPRIAFSGNCCFARCVRDCLIRHQPHFKVDSDSEPFVVPGLPHRITLTRSQLPVFLRQKNSRSDIITTPEEKSFGTVTNSFLDLEPAYVNFFRNEMGKKAWILGPVSLCNRKAGDKAERGRPAAIDERSCLNWLDGHKPGSVIYISFGSLAHLSQEQLHEIAYGLEASRFPFIWVIGKILKSAMLGEKVEEEITLPDGFEERLKESQKGLIIRGWAPQLLILEHDSVGGFITHCGWNSTLEGVSAGVPMVTWPMSAEQFINEKLVTDVLGIGLQVGSREWAYYNERKETVGRDRVENAVKKLMGGGEEAVEMRRKAVELSKMAKRAVEEDGSSFRDARALIAELKSLRR